MSIDIQTCILDICSISYYIPALHIYRIGYITVDTLLERNVSISRTITTKHFLAKNAKTCQQPIWVCLKMLCTPLYPMVLLIIIPIKWLFHWEYTQHFRTNPYSSSILFYKVRGLPVKKVGSWSPINGGLTLYRWKFFEVAAKPPKRMDVFFTGKIGEKPLVKWFFSWESHL